MAILRSVPQVAPQWGSDGEGFGNAVRELAGGVCVVTAGCGGQRTGLTTRSVVALSIEPPRLLVCIGKDTEAWPILNREGCFGVSLLCAHHELVADRFACNSGLKGEARYAEANWMTLRTGVKVLTDALAAIDCDVEEIIDRHAQSIVIGRACAAAAHKRTSGLVSWRGHYEQLGWSDLEASLAVGL